MLIKEITQLLENIAPLQLQEGYDNCGMQIGNPAAECCGVLITLDITPGVIDEAIELGCNLVISHHPLLFKGVKKITGRTLVEQSIIKAIKHDIAIYTLHTAIDNAPGGVSHAMARRLGIAGTTTLAPQSGKLMKVQVYVPCSHTDAVSSAIFEAGAGTIGDYDSCSFSTQGTGSFRPLEGAHPYVSSGNRVHLEPETKVEMIAPVWLKSRIEKAIKRVHPYEEPAYDFIALDNYAARFGSGAVGNLPVPMSATELVDSVKKAFGSPIVRCTDPPTGPIVKVAMCGGSGSFLINDAIAAGADAFITSDTSYHNFIDYAESIFIIDIGHYESESCTKEIFYRVIKEKFPNFAVHYSTSEKNPITYL